mgnify:CR=1 FL=1
MLKEVGAYLYEQLEQLTTEFDCIKDHRGIGLMQGIELTIPVGDVIKRLKRGLNYYFCIRKRNSILFRRLSLKKAC